MKNKFLVNIKYTLLFQRYYILIALILGFFIGILYSYNTAVSFNRWYLYYISTTPNIDPGVVNNQIKFSVYTFWWSSIPLIFIFIAPIASIIASQNEENDMNHYIMIYYPSRISLFISLLITLFVMGASLIFMEWVVFTVVFNYMTGFLAWYPQVFLAVVVVFILVLLLSGLIGIAIKKRAWSVIISIFFAIFIMSLSSIAYNQGINYVDNRLEYIDTVQEYRSTFPLIWKILTFLNPLYLLHEFMKLLLYPQTLEKINNISILDFNGCILLYLLWYFLLILLGYLIFTYKHPLRKVVRV